MNKEDKVYALSPLEWKFVEEEALKAAKEFGYLVEYPWLPEWLKTSTRSSYLKWCSEQGHPSLVLTIGSGPNKLCLDLSTTDYDMHPVFRNSLGTWLKAYGEVSLKDGCLSCNLSQIEEARSIARILLELIVSDRNRLNREEIERNDFNWHMDQINRMYPES